jgi:hypothetical protein
MSDTLSGLLGFALIAGLFVAYAMQRRARKRPAKPVCTVSPEPVGWSPGVLVPALP